MEIRATLNDKEALLNIKGEDISILYALQHELLLNKKVEFAGFALKHPLTLEYEMKVIVKSGDPVAAIMDAIANAKKEVESISKLVKAKVE